jgi:putative membrane protein
VDGELKTLASSKGVQLPAEPTRKVRSALSDLQKKSGPDFDKEYADDIAVDAHEDAVKLFEKAAKDAEDADVKAFAAKTLPNLQQHLAKGKELQSLIKSTHDNAKMKR